MKVTLLTIGSHGDVQPCVILAKRLKAHGYQVRIASLEASRCFILENNIEYRKISGDAKEVIRLLIGNDVKPLEYFRSLQRLLDPIENEFLNDIERCCDDTDIILYSVLGSIVYHVAQARHIPCIRMLFVPLDPTSEFPAMTAPIIGNIGFYNKLTYKIGDWLWTDFTRKRLNNWRKRLGIGSVTHFPYRNGIDGEAIPTVYAFSKYFVRRPPDWGKHIHLTGYWFQEESELYNPPKVLTDFLKKGEPPIYVGFGSMVGGNFKHLLSDVVEGIQKAGVRAVLSSGWGGLSTDKFPNSIIQVEYVPHDWLFRQVSMVVHHGGAGTVAAGLRYGKPTLVVPFGGDQPFWGNQVYHSGAGPKPIPIRHFKSDLFANRIQEVYKDHRYAEKAEQISSFLLQENGSENTVQIIEDIYKSSQLDR